MPRDKHKGDRVLSGSVVSMGFLQVVAELPVHASFHSRMADAVRDAKGTLSDTEAIVGEVESATGSDPAHHAHPTKLEITTESRTTCVWGGGGGSLFKGSGRNGRNGR